MPLPLEQVFNALKEQLPKVLVGLIVPASQLIWKAWQDRKANTRAAALRAEIKELAQFLQTPFGDSPNASAIRQSTQKQYERALNELAELSYPSEAKMAEAPQNSGGYILKRIFLFYTPHSFIGWVAHFLFYVFLAISVLGTIGMIMSGDASEDPGSAIGTIVFYGIVTLLIWRWAIRTSDPSRTKDRKVAPAWVPLVLIVITAILGMSTVLGLSLDDQEEFSSAAVRNNIGILVLVTAVSTIVIMLCLGWRRRVNANRPHGPRWGWVPVVLIAIFAYLEFGFLIAAMMNDQEEFSLKAFRENVGLFVTMTAMCATVIVLNVLWRRRMYDKTINSESPLEPGSQEKGRVIGQGAGTGTT